MEIDLYNLNEHQNLVLKSITHGKIEIFKSAKIQAYSSAITEVEDINLTLSYLRNNQRISDALSIIYAFKIDNSLQSIDKTHLKNIYDIEEFNIENNIAYGFNNDGEAGAGEKLLFLLDRMEVINIMMAVVVWNTSKNKFANDLNRLVINKSKDLLNLLHEKVIEVEHNRAVQLQDWHQEKEDLKRVLVPNVAEINADFSREEPAEKQADLKTLARADSELNFLAAVEDAEAALRMFNRGDIEKLISITKPNPSEESIMRAVIVLKKGHNHVIEDPISEFTILLSDINFRSSLLAMDVFSLNDNQIAKINGILKANKVLNLDYISKVNPALSKLYKYLINLVKWFNGHKLYKFDEQVDEKNTSRSQTQNSKNKKSNKAPKPNKNVNMKNMELNVNYESGKRKEESTSRRMEHQKVETLNQEEHVTEEDQEDPETQELKVLVSQIPAESDDLMQFTQNLKLEEYPTEFLVVLADKLKKRREGLYSDNKKSEENDRRNIISRGNIPVKK